MVVPALLVEVRILTDKRSLRGNILSPGITCSGNPYALTLSSNDMGFQPPDRKWHCYTVTLNGIITPALPALRSPRLPGPGGLELVGVSLDARPEVVLLPLLHLAEHAVRLHHLDVLLVNQLPVELVNAEVLVRVELLKTSNFQNNSLLYFSSIGNLPWTISSRLL